MLKKIINRVNFLLLIMFFIFSLCSIVEAESINYTYYINYETNLISLNELKEIFLETKFTIPTLREFSDTKGISGKFNYRSENKKSYSISNNNWELGFFHKKLVRFVGSDGFVDFIKDIDNEDGSYHNIAYRRNIFQYQGLKVDYEKDFIFNNVQYKYKFYLDILKGEGLHQEDFTGYALPENSNHPLLDINYQISADRKVYSSQSGASSGYSLGCSSEFTLPGDYNLYIKISNILGSLKWNDVLYREEEIQTNTGYLDEDGNIEYGPTLSGFQRKENYIYKFPLKINASIYKEYSNKILGLDLNWQEWDETIVGSASKTDIYYVLIYK